MIPEHESARLSGAGPEPAETGSGKKPKKEPKRIRVSLLLAVFIALLLCLATFLTTYSVLTLKEDAETAALKARLARFSKLEGMLDTITDRYVDEADASERLEKAYAGLFDDLDPYSYYMSAEDYAAFRADGESNYAGIGASITCDPVTEGMYVYRVLPDGPAEKAGLRIGDIVVAVDGVSLTASTFSAAVSAVAGDPGTAVVLTVLRGGGPLSREDLTVTRAIVASRAVWYQKRDNGVAYIEITDFSGNYVVDQFKAALEQAKSDGCTACLFDVRNNPGGDLNVICSVLDLLLPEGPIVHIVSGESEGQTVERVISSDAEQLFTGPMAVLCNGSTASAAELFTADLKEYGLAVVVGETTHGKGSVQSIFTCPDGSGYKLTTSYYTPKSGVGYHKKGVTPDVEITLSDDPNANRYRMSDAEDRQLQKALEVLNKQQTH